MILDRPVLDQIDCLARRLDERKLDNILSFLTDNLVQEVRTFAPIQDADNADRKEIVTANYHIGWDFARKNYDGQFNLVLLSEVAGRVNPELCSRKNNYADWRTSGATLTGLRHRPPADEARIMNQLNRLCTVINEQQLHPVEEALLLNFHLTRIQPFANGNKRTASIMTNAGLIYHKLAPIYVTPQEHFTYTSLLNAALNGYEEASSSVSDPLEAFYNPDYQQKGFYEFLGNKIVQNLVWAEDKLRQYPVYEIDLTARQPGVYFRVKKELDGFFRHAGVPHQVRLNRNGRNYVQVVGDISCKELDNILSRNKGLQKYTIDCKRMPPDK